MCTIGRCGIWEDYEQVVRGFLRHLGQFDGETFGVFQGQEHIGSTRATGAACQFISGTYSFRVLHGYSFFKLSLPRKKLICKWHYGLQLNLYIKCELPYSTCLMWGFMWCSGPLLYCIMCQANGIARWTHNLVDTDTNEIRSGHCMIVFSCLLYIASSKAITTLQNWANYAVCFKPSAALSWIYFCKITEDFNFYN